MSIKPVSERTISRMPKYLHYLNNLKENGVDRVSSASIAEALGTTASQVRQDLSAFGSYGAQGYGYSIDRLSAEIKGILGIDTSYRVAIIGIGSLGHALLEHLEFEKYGYHVVAGFDIDCDLIGTEINHVPIYSMDDLADVMKQQEIDICVLTVSRGSAKQVASYLERLGVSAIWNFTNEKLEIGESVAVENIDLIDSLFVLTYYMNRNIEERLLLSQRQRRRVNI